MRIKPENQYYLDYGMTIEDVRSAFASNATISAKVWYNDLKNKRLCLKIGDNLLGYMSWKDSSIYPLTNKYEELTTVPDQISAILGHKVRVKVKAIDAEGNITLSRKANMAEAWKKIVKMPNNYIFKASAIGVHKNGVGVYFDIGEGITAFCHLHQFTSTKADLKNWIKFGDVHEVAIHDIDISKMRISCSRKMTCTKDYHSFSQYELVDVKIAAPIYEGTDLTGYHVEVTPTVCGIADVPFIPRKLEYGETVRACIKKIRSESRKMTLSIL